MVALNKLNPHKSLALESDAIDTLKSQTIFSIVYGNGCPKLSTISTP